MNVEYLLYTDLIWTLEVGNLRGENLSYRGEGYENPHTNISEDSKYEKDTKK